MSNTPSTNMSQWYRDGSPFRIEEIEYEGPVVFLQARRLRPGLSTDAQRAEYKRQFQLPMTYKGKFTCRTLADENTVSFLVTADDEVIVMPGGGAAQVRKLEDYQTDAGVNMKRYAFKVTFRSDIPSHMSGGVSPKFMLIINNMMVAGAHLPPMTVISLEDQQNNRFTEATETLRSSGVPLPLGDQSRGLTVGRATATTMQAYEPAPVPPSRRTDQGRGIPIGPGEEAEWANEPDEPERVLLSPSPDAED